MCPSWFLSVTPSEGLCLTRAVLSTGSDWHLCAWSALCHRREAGPTGSALHTRWGHWAPGGPSALPSSVRGLHPQRGLQPLQETLRRGERLLPPGRKSQASGNRGQEPLYLCGYFELQNIQASPPAACLPLTHKEQCWFAAEGAPCEDRGTWLRSLSTL